MLLDKYQNKMDTVKNSLIEMCLTDLDRLQRQKNRSNDYYICTFNGNIQIHCKRIK